jgi:hypothetical protein
VKVNGHQESGHLFFGDLATDVRVKDPRDGVVAQRAAVTFGVNDVDRGEVVHEFLRTPRSSGPKAPGNSAPSFCGAA